MILTELRPAKGAGLEELDFDTEARNLADLTQAVRRHEMVTVPASVALLTRS